LQRNGFGYHARVDGSLGVLWGGGMVTAKWSR
jgi:hypothetical protein